jgi:hypothetical protein
VNVTFRPIDGWPGEPTPTHRRRRSRFEAPYSATLELLERELKHLGARLVVIQLHLSEGDIRLDGLPRANARPTSPGVIVSFESRHGPLRYFTDVFDRWQDNLRAVALGLEALRKVDRYGISRRGEQYRGWRAIEGGGGEGSPRERAARFVLDHVPHSKASPQKLLDDLAAGYTDGLMSAYRVAAKRLHPDAGGDPGMFERLQEARDLLLGEVGE